MKTEKVRHTLLPVSIYAQNIIQEQIRSEKDPLAIHHIVTGRVHQKVPRQSTCANHAVITWMKCTNVAGN